MVGDDEAGSQVERLLEGGGIHSYLQRDAAISTIIKLRVIGRQQQMLRIDFEDAPSDTVLRDKLTQFNALLPRLRRGDPVGLRQGQPGATWPR